MQRRVRARLPVRLIVLLRARPGIHDVTCVRCCFMPCMRLLMSRPCPAAAPRLCLSVPVSVCKVCASGSGPECRGCAHDMTCAPVGNCSAPTPCCRCDVVTTTPYKWANHVAEPARAAHDRADDTGRRRRFERRQQGVHVALQHLLPAHRRGPVLRHFRHAPPVSASMIHREPSSSLIDPT